RRSLNMTNKVYRAMTIAGSDSGGGAGIQADLKTFMAFDVLGTSAITAITAQNTMGVSGIHYIPPDMVKAQLEAVLSDIGADAVKTGMLGKSDIIRTIAGCVRLHGIKQLVVDPVMVSTSGHRLLLEDSEGSYRNELLPLALLVTPNLYEAEILSGQTIDSPGTLKEAALRILALGPRWVLLKGGHSKSGCSEDTITDLLTDGSFFEEIENKRYRTSCTHGTGCTLSAAITAGLARGMEIPEAVKAAENYLNEAIRTAIPVGRGNGPVNHNHRLQVKAG
ncbi:MAG: bifunctional hydroxymethylpyrimidine kinase/phosphomethylpyrimidine kinase, partial [Desulfocucumaceae bacterium]